MSGAGHGQDMTVTAGRKTNGSRCSFRCSPCFSISETLGKGAQTTAIDKNIEASNLWSFFQAKTIRMTVVRTAAEAAELELGQMGLPKSKEAINSASPAGARRPSVTTASRKHSEGRKELAARAKDAEKVRDRSLAAYHHYETASAALQIAIVLASAAIVTVLWCSHGRRRSRRHRRDFLRDRDFSRRCLSICFDPAAQTRIGA